MFENDKETMIYTDKQALQQSIIFDNNKAIDLLKRFSVIKRIGNKEERRRLFKQLSYDITKYVVKIENQNPQTDHH